MTNNLNISTGIPTNSSLNVEQEQRKLLKPFWLAITILLLVEIFTVKVDSVASIAGAILIAFAALLPVYLWCSGKALGMPIFPIFTLTYLWTHALPLLSNNPKVTRYSSEQQLFASLTVTGFLLLGTFVWFLSVNSPPPTPKQYRVLSSKESNGFFLVALLFTTLFYICSSSGWLTFDIGTFSLVRSFILGLNSLAVFVLSYRFGSRELSKDSTNIFLTFLIICIASSTTSLLLVDGLCMVFLATIAFVLGRKKVPWLPVAIVLICFIFMHYGKAEMRAKYWAPERIHSIQPWEYPALYGEWINDSIENFDVKGKEQLQQKSTQEASFAERSSVIQMLLLAQSVTPKRLPYLSGATYSIIPELLVPRILNKNKIRSHQGTYILSIYYGLQNYQATLSTTIAWGLLSEAYANFGLLGCAGLSIILGLLYGQATRWSLNTPILSSRSLFCAILISFAFQAEWTAGVYAAALFQSLVSWGIISLVFMKVHTNKDQEIVFIPYV